MKMYGNGQRPTKMYGGGMTSPRKPMMMGGLAQENRTRQNQMTPKTADAGMMTDQKKFGMGYAAGSKVTKGAKPDYLDFDKDGNKKESMKQALKDKKGKSKV